MDHTPMPNRPQHRVLVKWRAALVAAALVPALLNSLLFAIGGTAWLIGTGCWGLPFLFFYLFYFPVRYRRFSFRLTADSLLVNSGVFYNNVTAVPLENIQFVTLLSDPLDRLLGLRTLMVTAPGGRMALPGLSAEDAAALAELLPGEGEVL